MADLHRVFPAILRVGRAHPFGLIERSGKRLFLVHVLARFECGAELLGVHVRRRGDHDRINRGILEERSVVGVLFGGRGEMRRLLQASVVDVRKGHHFGVGAYAELIEKLHAAVARADDPYADAVTGAEGPDRPGGKRSGQAGSNFA